MSAKITKEHTIASFFKDEQAKLLGYTRRLTKNNPAYDAEDIVHDVIVKVLDTADINNPILDLSSYIYSSLKNRVFELLRKKQPDNSLDATKQGNNGLSLKDILTDARYNSDSELEKEDIKEKLFQAIDSLKDDERALIIASEFERKSFKELSLKWDIPIGTLLSRKSRALKKLAKELQKHKNQIGE